jgi:hypothetical protein
LLSPPLFIHQRTQIKQPPWPNTQAPTTDPTRPRRHGLNQTSKSILPQLARMILGTPYKTTTWHLSYAMTKPTPTQAMSHGA